MQLKMLLIKQGYELKNWETPNFFLTKIGQPYICQQTKECFDLSIKANLQVFRNHRKQAKNYIVFHFSPLLDLTMEKNGNQH